MRSFAWESCAGRASASQPEAQCSTRKRSSVETNPQSGSKVGKRSRPLKAPLQRRDARRGADLTQNNDTGLTGAFLPADGVVNEPVTLKGGLEGPRPECRERSLKSRHLAQKSRYPPVVLFVCGDARRGRARGRPLAGVPVSPAFTQITFLAIFQTPWRSRLA